MRVDGVEALSSHRGFSLRTYLIVQFSFGQPHRVRTRMSPPLRRLDHPYRTPMHAGTVDGPSRVTETALAGWCAVPWRPEAPVRSVLAGGGGSSPGGPYPLRPSIRFLSALWRRSAGWATPHTDPVSLAHLHPQAPVNRRRPMARHPVMIARCRRQVAQRQPITTAPEVGHLPERGMAERGTGAPGAAVHAGGERLSVVPDHRSGPGPHCAALLCRAKDGHAAVSRAEASCAEVNRVGGW